MIYAEISFERESTKFVYSILHTTNTLIHCWDTNDISYKYYKYWNDIRM